SGGPGGHCTEPTGMRGPSGVWQFKRPFGKTQPDRSSHPIVEVAHREARMHEIRRPSNRGLPRVPLLRIHPSLKRWVGARQRDELVGRGSRPPVMVRPGFAPRARLLLNYNEPIAEGDGRVPVTFVTGNLIRHRQWVNGLRGARMHRMRFGIRTWTTQTTVVGIRPICDLHADQAIAE